MANALNTLRDLRDGGALDDLGDAIANVVAHVRHSGKAGKVTLTLTVKPASRGNVHALTIDDAITLKLPTLVTESTLLFVHPDTGALSTRDPRQKEITR